MFEISNEFCKAFNGREKSRENEILAINRVVSQLRLPEKALRIHTLADFKHFLQFSPLLHGLLIWDVNLWAVLYELLIFLLFLSPMILSINYNFLNFLFRHVGSVPR